MDRLSKDEDGCATKGPRELIRALYNLEEGNDLFSIKVEGQDVWNYVRYGVSEHLYSRATGTSPNGRSGAKRRIVDRKRILEYLEGLLRLADYLSSLYLSEKVESYDILIVNTHNKGKVIDGKIVDFLFYPIVSNMLEGSNEHVWKEFISILNKVKENIGTPIKTGLIKFSQIGVNSPFFIEEYLGKAFVHPYAISTVACAIFIFINKL